MPPRKSIARTLDNADAKTQRSGMPSEILLHDLACALRERLTVIADRGLRESRPDIHLEKLKAASEKITRLQAQLPPGTDPHLVHFLKNCSYDKALALLESR
jgi:hypothetical protein